MKIYHYSLLLKLSFVLSFLSVNAQVKVLYKPEKALLKVIDRSLSESSMQYKVLMKNLPDTLFPRTFEKSQLKATDSRSWTAGFYPATLLYLYEYNKDKAFLTAAKSKLKLLEDRQFEISTHDLGFIMFCTFGNAKRILDTKEYDLVLLNSAKSLSARFHNPPGLIRSWDANTPRTEGMKYPVIIDNMMNLELLTWASRFSGDSSFNKIAVSHADKTIQNHFRKDYSSYHLVDYDPETGKAIKKQTVQGFSDESAWARGQAWGLYGYTMMYKETKNKRYLAQAKHIAHFILSNPNLPKDKIPYWDFNASNIPDAPRDASAGAVICSALIDLAGFTGGTEGNKFFEASETMLKALSSDAYRNKIGEDQGFLLKHSVGFLPLKSEIDVPLSYADYYYVEAMLRYKNLARKY